jgi:hypothetical protein
MDDARDKGAPEPDKVKPAKGSGGRGRKATPDAAFDLWLQRGLHAMFDDVAQEPVPEELMRLLREDRDG